MDEELVYRILLLALLIVFILHRGYYNRKYRRSDDQAAKQQEKAITPPLANLTFLLALVSSLIYIFFPTWLEWASLPFPTWLRWAGVGFALLGFALLQWAQNTLGKNWSDTPRLLEEQTLTTSGPYRWIRHPIYTAFLVILSAPLFISANWLVGLLWIGSTYWDVILRVRYEEEILTDRFGDQYRDYQQSTGRLLPKGWH